MAVKFIIDSASDILPEQASALNVVVVPVQVIFGDKLYLDGEDLTHEEFYRALAAAPALPTTSQPSPAAFADRFRSAAADGSEVVVITISSALSGTYQSAVIAAAEFEGVHVVDSLSAAVGERVLLLQGLELARQGLSAAQIAARLDEEKKQLQVVAIVDTLEYLKKGGRISSATALTGTLLSIKPAIALEDGKVAMAGTARGSRKAGQLLYRLIEEKGPVDRSKPVCFVYSGMDDRLLQDFLAQHPELCQGTEPLPVYSLGCAIGTHVGPGAFGMAFFSR